MNDTHGLTFAALREANERRLGQFKNSKGGTAHSEPDGSDWSVAQWLQAVVGELGEFANFRKKFERGDLSFREYAEHARKELADVQTYLDILALRALDSIAVTQKGGATYRRNLAHPLGVNLGEATIAKFNEVSERIGCDIRLLPETPEPEPLLSPEEIAEMRASMLKGFKESLGRKGLFGLDHVPALGAQASRAADALYEGNYPADMPPEAVERIRSILSGSVELPTGSGLTPGGSCRSGAPIPADPEPQSPDSCSQEPCEPSEPQSPDLAGASPEPPIRSPELAESEPDLYVEPCPRCGASCDVEPSTAQVWCHEWCGYSYLVANIRPVDVRPEEARQPATFAAVLEAHNRDCRDLRAMRMLRTLYDEGYGAELISFAHAGWTATKKSRVVPLFSVDADDPAEAILGLEEKPDA